MHPTVPRPEGITKPDKEFARELDFKDITFLVKVTDICKVEKKVRSL